MRVVLKSEDGLDRLESNHWHSWTVFWRGEQRGTFASQKAASIELWRLRKMNGAPKPSPLKNRLDHLLADSLGTLMKELTPDEIQALRDTPVRGKNIQSLQCPDCGASLVLRTGRFGRFYGCEMHSKTLCRGSVSADDNGNPLGIPVNQVTRAARRRLAAAREEVATTYAKLEPTFGRYKVTAMSFEECMVELTHLEARYSNLTQHLDALPDPIQRYRWERLTNPNDPLETIF